MIRSGKSTERIVEAALMRNGVAGLVKAAWHHGAWAEKTAYPDPELRDALTAAVGTR